MPTISFGYKIGLLENLAEQIGEVKAVVPASLIKKLKKEPIKRTARPTSGSCIIVMASQKIK